MSLLINNRDLKNHKNLSSLRFLLLFLLTLSVVAVVGSLFTAQSASTPIMPSKEVQVGMRGYGLSVFQGTNIESFPVVVVGKVRGGLYGSDMIIVKLLGGYPVDHRLGVIAGMSGSPVYINGRLIGAIGYGWAFSQEPLGGVAPIESMMEELPPKGDKKGAKISKIADCEGYLDQPFYSEGKEYKHIVVTNDYSPDKSAYPPDTILMAPVPSLLQVGGFSPRTVEFIREQMKETGLEPVSVPVSTNKGMGEAKDYYKDNIRGGSALGVTFMDGDLYMGGTGTVTYRSGNTLLAFGHPMMQMGETQIPICAAYIEGIVPSAYRPFKLSSSLGIVGTLVEDRLYAVAGNINQTPPMIPMTIQVKDQARKRERNYKVRVMDQRYITPMIMTFAGLEAVMPSGTSLKERTAGVHYSIKLKGYDKMEFDDIVVSKDIDFGTAIQMMGYFRALSLHDFEAVEFERVDVAVTFHDDIQKLTIKDVSAQLNKVHPGDTLKVNVRMEKNNNSGSSKETETRTFNIPIPADVKKGKIKILVAGGDKMDLLEKKVQMLPLEPQSRDQIVNRVRDKDRGNQIVLLASFPRSTVNFYGERLRNLSQTTLDIFNSSPRSSVQASLDSYKTALDTPCYVEGDGMITVDISEQVPSAQDGYDSKDSSSPGDPSAPGNSAPPLQSYSTREKLYKNLGERMEIVKIPRREEDPSPLPAQTTDPVTGQTLSSSPSQKEQSVITGTHRLVLDTALDYFLGVFDGTSITEGNITLGKSLTPLYSSSNPFIWAMVYDKASSTVYAGESPSGRILAIKEGEKPQVVAQTRETLITCMTQDTSGIIYIGTSPHGRIFKLKPGGKLERVADLKESFIWDLKTDSSSNLIVATGVPGAVYRITPAGEKKQILSAPGCHVQCLEITPDDTVFAGIANEGAVYMINGSGKATPYFGSDGNSIEAILYDKGDLWVASQELLYRVKENGEKKVFILPEGANIRLAKDSLGNICVATSNLGRVYRIAKNHQFQNLYEEDINQVFSILPLEEGSMIISTGNPGKVIKIKNQYRESGSYLTRVLDTKAPSRFGKVSWKADLPGNSQITFQTRTGNTLSPDNTWSPWSPDYSMAEGQNILSPDGRYIQVKVNMKTSDTKVTPTLYSLSVYCKNLNHSPILVFTNPSAQAKWSDKVKVQWKAYVTNPETVAFSLYYSEDNGKSWKPLQENIAPSLKDLRSDKKDKPVQNEFEWKTARFKDGPYLLKLKGFDRTDAGNPLLTSEIISKPIIICNKPPEITFMGEEAGEERLIIKGFAKTYLTNIKEITYQIDNKEWDVAFPSDGVFDDTREKFEVYLNKPYPTRFKIKIKVTDEAGNTKIQEKSVSVSRPKPTKDPEDKKNNKDNP